MTALQAAIVAAWKANGTLANLPLSLDVAPDGTPFPYGTYSIIPGASASYNFGQGTNQQNIRVRFSIWHNVGSSLATLRAAVHATFELRKLSLSSGQCMTAMRKEDFERTVPRDSNADGQGSRATQSVTSYEFKTINPN